MGKDGVGVLDEDIKEDVLTIFSFYLLNLSTGKAHERSSRGILPLLRANVFSQLKVHHAIHPLVEVDLSKLSLV